MNLERSVSNSMSPSNTMFRPSHPDPQCRSRVLADLGRSLGDPVTESLQPDEQRHTKARTSKIATSVSESLSELLFQHNLDKFEEALMRAGVWTTEDLKKITSPYDLPSELHPVTRKKFVALSSALASGNDGLVVSAPREPPGHGLRHPAARGEFST